MNIYMVYTKDSSNLEGNRLYALKERKAIQYFNDSLRDVIKEVYEQVDKSIFSIQVKEFKQNEGDKVEIICRKCPFIIYRENDLLIGRVYSWTIPDEYDEQFLISEEVILQKIELIE